MTVSTLENYALVLLISNWLFFANRRQHIKIKFIGKSQKANLAFFLIAFFLDNREKYKPAGGTSD